MENKGSVGIGVGYGISVLAFVIVVAIAWIQGGGINAAIGAYLTGTLYALTLVVSYIPVLGVFIQYYLIQWFVIPYLAVSPLVPASVSWINDFYYWYTLLLGAITTMIMTLGIVVLIFDRK